MQFGYAYLGRAQVTLIPESLVRNGSRRLKSLLALEMKSRLRNIIWILLLSCLTSANAHVEKSDRDRLAVVFGVVQRLFSSELDTELLLNRTGARAWYYPHTKICRLGL